jgi:hypothetical protein
MNQLGKGGGVIFFSPYGMLVIWCACLLVPSIAFAHGLTTEGLAVFLLRVDVLISLFAFICVLISSELKIRLLTLFSTINILISIIGILLKVIIYFGAATSSSNDFFSFLSVIALVATGYLVFALPTYFVILLIGFIMRSLAKL